MQQSESILAIVAEMRERRVNGGKHTSPTLEGWADRIEAALRAQADARPVAMEYVAVADDGGKLSWVSGRKPRDCALYAIAPTNSGLAPAFYVTSVLSAQAAADVSEIYTHPEASAPGLSEDERRAMERAAEIAEQHGAIGPAHTLRAILTRASAATASPDARIEELRKGLFEARDAMRVMSNWVKQSDPAGYSWGVRMVDRANAVLSGAAIQPNEADK